MKLKNIKLYHRQFLRWVYRYVSEIAFLGHDGDIWDDERLNQVRIHKYCVAVFGSGGIIDESKGFGVDDNIKSSIQKSATDILWINFIEFSLP
jgi:hypothetical protein